MEEVGMHMLCEQTYHGNKFPSDVNILVLTSQMFAVTVILLELK